MLNPTLSHTPSRLRVRSSSVRLRGAKSPVLLMKCGLALAFSLFALIVYEMEIAVRWAYLGFAPIQNFLLYAFILLASLFMAAFIPLRHNARSFLLTALLYIFFIPSMLIGVSNRDLEHLFALGLAVSLIFIVSSLALRPIRLPPVRPKTFLNVCLLACVLLVIALVSSGASRSFNLDILLIYELRAESTANMSAALAYSFSGISKVIMPAAVIFATRLQNWKLLLAVGVLVVVVYGMTYHKSVLAIPLAAGIIYFFQKDRGDNLILHGFFVAVFAVSLIDSILVLLLDYTGFFSSFIARRVFFLPGLIDSFYIDFFSDGEKYLWSTSALGFGLAEIPYSLTAPHLIGEAYFGSSDMGANTGIVGSGYAHAGFFGVALYAAFLGLVIGIFNSYGRIVGHAAVACISLPIVITIANTSDFTTVILTHGLALMLLLLLLFPRESLQERANGVAAR